VPFQLHTVGNEYAAVHVFHIERVQIKVVQKSYPLIFRYSVWMNTFCYRVGSMSALRKV